MLKHILIILFVITTSMSCSTDHKMKQADTDDSLQIDHADVDSLPRANYASLTQVYDRHALENRMVTFRDERLLTSRGIKTLYHMPVYKTVGDWEKRKQYLKEHILVCTGLWPMPEKSSSAPVYHHKTDHEDYIVETVTIETYPGFFLAGNVYRPKGEGPFPAILSPHGHFPYGRLNNDATNSTPARCINLARQGYVVFAYDMVGYNDTRQVSHRFANDSISHLYGINLLGLQLRNSICALDFLRSLPQTDTSRIGITGASGGGTQVFLLTAVDNRFQAAAPVNMVSDNMQGGDVCENAPGLRTKTFNVEIAAMIAPKPLLLVSNTHDWTYDTRNTIMPMIHSIYGLYHAEDKVQNVHFDYIHNYNKASREAVYAFLGKWLLHEPDPAKLREKPFVVDSDTALLAFLNEKTEDRMHTFTQLPPTAYHDVPNQMDEAGLKAVLKKIYTNQLAHYWPKDNASLKTFRSIYGTAARHLISAEVPEAIDIQVAGSSRGNDFVATRLWMARKGENDWIPCILYEPLSPAMGTVIVTGEGGKAQWVAAGGGAPNATIEKLIEQKYNVLAPDLFKQGEHVLQDSTMTRRDEKEDFFVAYNLTDRQEKIQDLLTIIQALHKIKGLSGNISVYATGNTGMTALLLAAVTDGVSKWVIDGNHFDPTTDENMLRLQIPGIMRIGGLKTLLALAADKHLLLYNAHPALLSSGAAEIGKIDKNQGLTMITTPLEADKALDFLKP